MKCKDSLFASRKSTGQHNKWREASEEMHGIAMYRRRLSTMHHWPTALRNWNWTNVIWLIFQRVFDLPMKVVDFFKGMFGLFHENALSSRVLCFSMKMIDCSKGFWFVDESCWSFKNMLGRSRETCFHKDCLFSMKMGWFFKGSLICPWKRLVFFKGMFGLFHENALSTRVLCCSMKMIDCPKGL